MLLLDTNSQLIDYIDLAIKFAGLATIVFALLNYVFNRKKHYFEAIQFCWKRYREIVQKQQLLESRKKYYKDKGELDEYYEKHLILFKDHMGLVSEEVTYIKEGMLPGYVAKSWLYEMTKRVPFWQNGEWANLNLLKKGENKELAENKEDELINAFEEFEQLKLIFRHPEADKNEFGFDTEDIEKLHQVRQAFSKKMFKRIRNSRKPKFK